MLCPICKKAVEPADPYMPFCSDRCRILDLGNWASEKYVISSPAEEIESAESENSPEEDEGE